MASDIDTAPAAAAADMLPKQLRQRATALQVIGAPEVDRSAQQQQRLGFSLLVGLALGWDPLMVAANSTAPFHTAIGRFLLIFGATVFTIRALGNLYDQYVDEAAARQREQEAAERRTADAAAPINSNQPAPSAD